MYAYILADFDAKKIALETLARRKAVGSPYQVKTESYITYAVMEIDDTVNHALALAFDGFKKRRTDADFLERLNAIAEMATLIAKNHALAEEIVREHRREQEARELRALCRFARKMESYFNAL